MPRSASPQTAAILRALADRPRAWRHGYQLGQEVGLRSGTLYPILMRLADRGLLETSWETDFPTGRPPRHLYRLTEAGLTAAASLPAPTLTPSRALPATFPLPLGEG